MKRAVLTCYALCFLGILQVAKRYTIETWGRPTYEAAFEIISAVALVLVLSYGIWSIISDLRAQRKVNNE